VIVTVAPDLSEVTAVLPSGEWLRLGGFNPETQEPWVSPEAATEYAKACVGREGFWNSPDVPMDPAPVLPNLTQRQFRLGLLSAGLLAGVETAIDALPEPDRTAAKIEFEYASVVVRTDPWVTDLAAVLGLTDQEIDTLWLWASAL